MSDATSGRREPLSPEADGHDRVHDDLVPAPIPPATLAEPAPTVTVTVVATLEPGELDAEVVRLLLDRLVACELLRLRAFRQVGSWDVLSEVSP